MLIVDTIPILKDNYSYLIHDTDSDKTAVIDPAAIEPILAKLQHRQWKLDYIFNTHHHPDHVGGNLALQAYYGCKIIGSLIERHSIPGLDIGLNDGDQFAFGNQLLRVIATPGHTHGHLVYYFPYSGDLFTGDTLFIMGCGRLFEGTMIQLWQSLQKLKALPTTTRIYCAHEYSLTNALFALTVEPNNVQLQKRLSLIQQQYAIKQPTVPSTLAEELATNPFLREHHLNLQHNLKNTTQSPIEIFTQLRQLKDQFQA
ncbi:MAG: hydroxyacylglutathione hydrolase [Pseudomonadota bacterium]